MKKQNIWKLIFVFIFIFWLFSLWQYSIYQKLSKIDISCGGDWSYNVQCPIGSYCQSLGIGPLAGGLCKPFLSPLFDVFNKSKRVLPVEDLPIPIPTKQPTTDKIISSEVTVEDCKIKVVTTKGEIFLDTQFLEFYPQTRCYQFVLNDVSPSGKYIVFQDISGGLDSMLRVYSLEHNDTIVLDVFGTSNIFDISFLPDDKLISLYGYKGIYKEQYLKVFDLSGLFGSYPSNVNKHKYFTTNQYSKNITLPDIGRDYFSLSVSDGKLKIYGTGGVNAGILKEYSFDELLK